MSKEQYAFPHEINDNSITVHFGMTLRDYFAAKAMQGVCANPVFREQCGGRVTNISSYAYEIADAMLKQRLNNS